MFGRYVICAIDCTVWPADANYLAEAFRTFSSILSMSSEHTGWVQYPLLTSQTNKSAVIKRRHLLDNYVEAQPHSAPRSANPLRESVKFLSRRSQRALSQPAVAVFRGNFEASNFLVSAAVRLGKVGPCELVRIADMIGFDDSRRPGASARVEQTLGD